MRIGGEVHTVDFRFKGLMRVNSYEPTDVPRNLDPNVTGLTRPGYVSREHLQKSGS